MSGSEELITKDKRKEQQFLKALHSGVPEHQADGTCEECGKELHSLEEAIAHLEADHPVAGDVVWADGGPQ